MVCSQDLEHLVHQQPFASFPGGTRDCHPTGLERVPGSPYGFASTASSHPHCGAAGPAAPRPPTARLHRCPGAILPPGIPQPPQPCWPCSQASLCPPVGPPWGCPLSVSRAVCQQEHKRAGQQISGRGSCWGRKQALLFSPVLYQDGPTLVSTGFLCSANERNVFTHSVLCSLTCELQSKPLLVVGPGQALDDPSPARQQARLFPEPGLAPRRISIRRNVMWLQSQGPALPTEVVSSWFLAGSLYVRTRPCALWLTEDPSSQCPEFWETETNSSLPSLEL